MLDLLCLSLSLLSLVVSITVYYWVKHTLNVMTNTQQTLYNYVKWKDGK